jgi:hypothetical protein
MPCIAMVSIITVEGEIYDSMSFHVHVQYSIIKPPHCGLHYAPFYVVHAIIIKDVRIPKC